MMRLFNDKKGSPADILIWLVVAFLTIFILGAFVFIFSSVGSIFSSVGSIGNDVNVTSITADTFGQVNETLANWVQILAFIILIGGAISIFISNFLVKSHPVFFVVYLLFTVVAIIVSAYLSNTWESILAEGIMDNVLQAFTGANFIMQWLPYFTAVIGIFGAIFLFIGILRDRDAGVGI